MTPQYEADQRGADYALSGTLQGIQNQQNLIDPMTQLMTSRLQTDQGYDYQRLMEDMANRGLVGSGPQAQLYQRDIGIPYGREYQDLALGAGQQYSDLMGQTSGAHSDYNSAMIEALLNRAAQAAQDMPLSLPSTYPPKNEPPKKNNRAARRRARRRRNNAKK